MRTELLIIDPQNDFCDPKGSLYVQGAKEDATRLGVLIDKYKREWYDIHMTMDSHHTVDVGHPWMWRDGKGNMPAPFTPIPAVDIENGVWVPFNPSYTKRMIEYARQLEVNDRYMLMVWPEHCVIGSWGYGIVAPIMEAVQKWEREEGAVADKVTKGSNIWTEHYSAVQADVPDPSDPSTQLNTRLIQTLQEADRIIVAGWASSHCLAFTIKDIADNFGEENIKKITLLIDCTSPVTGFEKEAERFISEMQTRGMQIAESVNVRL